MAVFSEILVIYVAVQASIYPVCESVLGEFSFKRSFDINYKPKPFGPFKYIREKWLPFGLGVRHHVVAKREVYENQEEDIPDKTNEVLPKPYEVNEVFETPPLSAFLGVNGPTLQRLQSSSPITDTKSNINSQTNGLYTDISKSVSESAITFNPQEPVLQNQPFLVTLPSAAPNPQSTKFTNNLQPDSKVLFPQDTRNPLILTNPKIPMTKDFSEQIPQLNSPVMPSSELLPPVLDPLPAPLFEPIPAEKLDVPIFRPVSLTQQQQQRTNFNPSISTPISGSTGLNFIPKPQEIFETSSVDVSSKPPNDNIGPMSPIGLWGLVNQPNNAILSPPITGQNDRFEETNNNSQSNRRPSLLRRSQLALEFGSAFLQFLAQFFGNARSSFSAMS